MTNPEFILHGENGVTRAIYNAGEIYQLERGETTTLELEIRQQDWSEFKQYGDRAGDFTTYEPSDFTYKYQLHIPPSADIGSLLFGIEPSTDLQNKGVTGIWGLVGAFEDLRPASLNTNRVRVELFVLAEYPDYSTHTAAVNELKVP